MERYIDSDGRTWMHPPHYGVYLGDSTNPWLTYSQKEAAEAVCQCLNENNLAITPEWLGASVWVKVREIKGIEIVG